MSHSSDLTYVPLWVKCVCCTAPFLALVLMAVAQLVGFTVATPAVACLALLCGSTTRHVLGIQAPTINLNLPRLTDRR